MSKRSRAALRLAARWLRLSLARIDTEDCPYENECVTIQGIVSPRHQSGMNGRNESSWLHYFEFAAWRRLGGPIVNRELLIIRPVERREDYFSAFPAYSVHRLSVLLSKDGRRAVLEKSVPMNRSDADLLAVERELRKPIIISTKTFGDLVLNRKTGWFEGNAKWNGKTVAVVFDTDDGKRAITRALQTAEAIWANPSRWKRDAEAIAVKELLPIKNGTWLGEGQEVLKKEEFVKRMSLRAIHMYEDGSFSFWYDDGGLFSGHVIEVGGSLKDGLRYASFHG